MRFYERALCDFHFNFYPPCSHHLEPTRDFFMDKLDNLNVNSLREAIDWILPEVMEPKYRKQHYFPIPDDKLPVLSQRFQEVFRELHININQNLRDPQKVFEKINDVATTTLGMETDCTGLRSGIYADFMPCQRYSPDFRHTWAFQPLHRCCDQSCPVRSLQLYGAPNKPHPVPVVQPPKEVFNKELLKEQIKKELKKRIDQQYESTHFAELEKKRIDRHYSTGHFVEVEKESPKYDFARTYAKEKLKVEVPSSHRLPPTVLEWRRSRSSSPEDGSTADNDDDAEFALFFPLNP